MIYLRQSTAGQEVPLGPFLDPTDGDTEETGLTIAATNIKLWKRGATSLADKNSGGATHMAGGIYYAVLDATDTDTSGSLVIYCHIEVDSNNANGALYVKQECEVLPDTVYDSLVLGTDNLQVDTVQVSGDSTAADNLESDYDGTGYNKSNSTIGTCSSSTLASTQGAITWGAVTVSVTGATDNVTLSGSGTGDGLAFTRSGAGDLFETNWAAAVESEVTDALNTYDPPTKAELDSGFAALNDPTAAAIRTEMDNNSTQLAAIVADTGELQSDWADGGRLDTILDARASQTSVDTIDSNVDDLKLGVILGQAQTGTLSTTQLTTDLTGYADDQLIYRVIIFTSGVCEGEARSITDYASASGLITMGTALTTAPTNTDTFKIV